MTDNVAILAGFTLHVTSHSDQYDFDLLVKPDTDFDDRFKAWDTDAQEYIFVNGWLFNTIVDENPSDPMEDFNYVGSRHHY